MENNWLKHKPAQLEYRGQYVHNWFSNMTELQVPIQYAGINFYSVENAYQAAKCRNSDDIKLFAHVTPHEAKRLGRKIAIRDNWGEHKTAAMARLIRMKFRNNPDQRELLLATGKSVIVEFNNWGDSFWGASAETGDGKNYLGLILMHIREELRKENELHIL